MASSQFVYNPDPDALFPVAQTNLQLWQQLQQAGYDRKDLEVVGCAYRLSMTLFSGQFRASGKTFIAHLVGTASILTHLKMSSAAIASGLLHAAYSCGDFGCWNRPGVTAFKQGYLRREVGNEIEQYITAYSYLTWNSQTIPKISKLLPSWDDKERIVLLIRLANELEEYLDLGLAYCGEKEEIYRDHQSEIICAMAKELGFSRLASALASAQKSIANAHVLPELVNPTGKPSSSLVVPHFYQKKFLSWLAQSLIGRFTERAIDNRKLHTPPS